MKITLLPGDGIGPEIIDAAVEVLNAVAEKHGLAFAYDHQLIGGAAFDATGSPLPEATVKSALQADAVLLGAVGGPKWDNVAPALTPRKGAPWYNARCLASIAT
jgi:3-isopropylmalate dehydrogenase